jgi:hypothetical protein
MEENSLLKCIRSSQEYGLGILDSFQYEPIYVFPKNFTGIYRPSHKVSGFEIIDLKELKCGLEVISQYYILSVVMPSLPSHMIKAVLNDVMTLILPIFMEMSYDEYQTPKSTDRHFKSKKLLKPELFEKLSEQLDSFMSLSFYRLFPYFLYEDEDFEVSSISFPCLSLPPALGSVACCFSLSIGLQLQIDMISQVLLHESTVTVHEILSLEQPSGVLKEIVLIYKGYLIAGSPSRQELSEIMRIYNSLRFYLRNDSFGEESHTEKVKISGEDFRVTLVSVRGVTAGVLIVPFSEGVNDYDPWMTAKVKRMLSEMNESKLIEKINQEFDQSLLKIESQILDANKKMELFNNMKKSRSLDSSPIGSPRSFGFKDKKYTPLFLSKHKIAVFHYALVDLVAGLVNSSHVSASGGFYMAVLRRVYCYYAELFEKISNDLQKTLSLNDGSRYFEVLARFPDYFECEKVAVVKFNNYLMFALYRGTIEGLKQFGYELICVNNKFY